MNAILGIVVFFALAYRLHTLLPSCNGVHNHLHHGMYVASTIGMATGALGLGFGWVGPWMLLVSMALRFSAMGYHSSFDHERPDYVGEPRDS